MSSLRNAIKRVTHKERAQPTSRKHLGLLEKHKDYKLRADNFHKKERRIKAMGERAAQRNPDEFYHAMHSSEVVKGKHRITDKKRLAENMATLGADAVELMKTQDLKYLRAVVSRDQKKAERLRASLHFENGGGEKKNKRVIFVESDGLPTAFKDDRDSEVDQGCDHDDSDNHGGESDADDEYDLDLQELREKLKKPKSEKELKREEKNRTRRVKEVEKAKRKSYNELKEREMRKEKLDLALKFIETEKNMTSKGAKRKVGEGKNGLPVYKWKRVRTR